MTQGKAESATRELIGATLDRAFAGVVALACLASLAACGGGTHPGGKESGQGAELILDGEIAQPGAYPWMAVILDSNEALDCGGSLVAPQWVLTAAHCVVNTPILDYEVVLGEHDLGKSDGKEQRFDIVEAHMHPDFWPNDIALLRLDKPATINARVQTIKLARGEMDPRRAMEVSEMPTWRAGVSTRPSRGRFPTRSAGRRFRS